jgi:NAD(P)-dependent dehydrogenase (short-subunit alcohol dehydrogenase family)
LGEGIARHLLARQVRVLGIARGGNAALAKEYGDTLREVALDLSDAHALAEWVDGGVLQDFVRGADVAILVNNAGLLKPIGPLQSQEPASVLRAIGVNVGAALALSAAFVRATDTIEDRRILHISSGAGSSAYAGWSVYCASKAALDHHARAVTLDRTPNLRIASVAPGVIDTNMQTEIRAANLSDFPDRPRFEALKREGRLRSPDEAGRDLVEYLLSSRFGHEPVTDLRYR